MRKARCAPRLHARTHSAPGQLEVNEYSGLAMSKVRSHFASNTDLLGGSTSREHSMITPRRDVSTP